MSFGNRNSSGNHNSGRQSPQQPSGNTENEMSSKTAIGHLSQTGLFFLGVLGIMIAVAWGPQLLGSLFLAPKMQNVHDSLRGIPNQIVLTSPDGENRITAIDARINSACLEGRYADHYQHLQMQGPTHVVPSFKLPNQQLSEYLACSMREEVERFCQPFYRTRLINRVQHIMKYRKRRIAMRQRYASNSMARQMMMQNNISDATTNRQGIVTGRPGPMAVIDPRIGEELRLLSQAGYITASDFGWSNTVPKNFQPYISSQSAKASCS